MNLKGIIYDFDGVICDSVNVKTKAFAEMYKSYGEDVVSKVVDYHLQHGGISRYEKFKYYHQTFLGIELTQEEIMQMGNKFSEIALQKVINSAYLPGVVDFMTNGKKNCLQFICTGTPETEILTILNKKNLEHLFDSVYGAPKRKPEIITMLLEQYQLHRDEVIFIGDALTDYNAARETNIAFVGVKSDNTQFPKVTYVIKDFVGVDAAILKANAVIPV